MCKTLLFFKGWNSNYKYTLKSLCVEPDKKLMQG